MALHSFVHTWSDRKNCAKNEKAVQIRQLFSPPHAQASGHVCLIVYFGKSQKNCHMQPHQFCCWIQAGFPQIHFGPEETSSWQSDKHFVWSIQTLYRNLSNLMSATVTLLPRMIHTVTSKPGLLWLSLSLQLLCQDRDKSNMLTQFAFFQMCHKEFASVNLIKLTLDINGQSPASSSDYQ